jgi:6-pyruvoyltetrahydropterin/6-carboxytetrahydropterin synthase
MRAVTAWTEDNDMYRVSVSTSFSAAHRLRLPDGAYEPPHGHDWSVEARFVGSQLDSTGLLIDFEDARAALQAVVGRLHHTDLNDCSLMAGLNPSAENVARVVFDALAGHVSRPELLESVHVVEAPGCTAAYFRASHEQESRKSASVDDEKNDR